MSDQPYIFDFCEHEWYANFASLSREEKEIYKHRESTKAKPIPLIYSTTNVTYYENETDNSGIITGGFNLHLRDALGLSGEAGKDNTSESK